MFGAGVVERKKKVLTWEGKKCLESRCSGILAGEKLTEMLENPEDSSAQRRDKKAWNLPYSNMMRILLHITYILESWLELS